MVKVFKGFRFDNEMYDRFKHITEKSNVAITEAFERFMTSCIDADCVVYYEKRDADCETEARVLVDWLNKGKYFYRTKTSEELSVQGALVELLHKVKSGALKKEIEECLKKSVKPES